MSASASWQAWRSAMLPALERILGRPLTQTTTQCPAAQLPRAHRVIQARGFSSAHVKRSQVSQDEANEPIQKDTIDRKQELDRSGIELYPRVNSPNNVLSLEGFNTHFVSLKPGEKHGGSGSVKISGRVTSIRKSGSKLAFVDVCEEPGQHKVQLMLNLNQMHSVEKKTFSNLLRLITRGDVIAAEGTPTRTSTGELSLLTDSLPKIFSPCLHRLPLTAYQSQTAADVDIDFPERHVEMLTDPSVVATMVVRSKLIRTMRDFFDSRDFLEVQTPILAAAAGGATARPFETVATEFLDKKLWLRIAPELWLKRLIIGGMSRIYEIGASFRNEGLDKTHNPEFTTCEFYATYHDLPQLQRLTETFLRSMSQTVQGLNTTHLNPPPPTLFDGTFPEIDFIPAINEALGHPLPNLATPTAHSEVLELFRSHDIPLPAKPTLPRLLDKLCARYLEPRCTRPTWIVNTPECLSPLAKSFVHPLCPNAQPVAARAELFISGNEVVNCYEEENSPFEQRRKFLDQQRFAKLSPPPPSTLPSSEEGGEVDDEEAQKIDHDYLAALEWGLPPTGGWGCGVDRLVMLFTGKERITDVLSFGNLRAVTRRGRHRLPGGDKDKKVG